MAVALSNGLSHQRHSHSVALAAAMHLLMDQCVLTDRNSLTQEPVRVEKAHGGGKLSESCTDGSTTALSSLVSHVPRPLR